MHTFRMLKGFIYTAFAHLFRSTDYIYIQLCPLPIYRMCLYVYFWIIISLFSFLLFSSSCSHLSWWLHHGSWCCGPSHPPLGSDWYGSLFSISQQLQPVDGGGL